MLSDWHFLINRVSSRGHRFHNAALPMFYPEWWTGRVVQQSTFTVLSCTSLRRDPSTDGPFSCGFCVNCVVAQYNEINVMHFSFSSLKIKGLYMFRALLAHPQEALHKRHLEYCVRIMSAGCGTIAVSLQPWNSQLTLYARSIPSAVGLAPPEDEQVVLETCRGPWFSINWMKSSSRWFHYTDILWCMVSNILSLRACLSWGLDNVCLSYWRIHAPNFKHASPTKHEKDFFFILFRNIYYLCMLHSCPSFSCNFYWVLPLVLLDTKPWNCSGCGAV
jgi:hypothetical protein